MNNPAAPHLQALTEGPNIPLDKPIVLIGRHQECDIQIPSRKISRRHCCLAQVGSYLVVRDLGSTNGIRINGVKVTEGNLQAGDELMIGNVRYQLRWGDHADQAAAAALKQGVMAPKPSLDRIRQDDSGEMPIALPDMSLSQPVLKAKPIPPAMQNKVDSGRMKENGEFPKPASF